MSFPNIPPVSPAIDVTVEEVVSILLASIAFEELGLAHVINSKAEQIQFVLGTLTDQTTSAPPTIADLLAIDQAVDGILRTVSLQEILLLFKLENIIQMPVMERVCLCGLQNGSSGSGVIPPGGDIRFVGGIANIQEPSVCDNCGLGAPDHLAYLVIKMGTMLRLTNVIITSIECPDPFNPNPTPTSPSTIVITGIGTVEFTNPPNPTITGIGTFTYTFNDGGTGPNSDSFSIVVVSSTPELNHNSGIVSLNGNLTIINCPQNQTVDLAPALKASCGCCS